MKCWAILGAVAASGLLVSCAAFRGNVRSNFVCEAPGGMCAPTSKIDDQALALIAEGEAALTRPLAAAATHSPRAMRIMLPARQDRFGHWREPTIVYAEPLDLAPELSAALAGGDRRDASAAQPGLADLAARAPALADIGGAAVGEARKEDGKVAVPVALAPAAIEAEVRRRLAAKGEGAAPASGGGALAGTVKAPSFPASDSRGSD